MSKPSICLASILRNEAHIVIRMMQSALPWVDSFFMIDTGSSDETIETVRAFAEAHDLPGEIISEPWTDFGVNRSSLVAQARQRGADYLLCLDADHVVRGEEGVLDSLGADGYQIQQGTASFSWWIPYLIRCDKPWKYVGSTHEFLTCDEPFECARLYGFELEHLGDGGTRPEKSERDLKMLEKDWTDGVMPDRTAFYLAQTYQDMGENEKALDFYQRRIDMGGWDEEIYISHMRRAAITGNLADYLRAHKARPSRSEALYYITKTCNELGYQFIGYQLCKNSEEYLTVGDSLFVDTWIESYGLAFELGIAAWHAGHVDESKKLFEEVLANPDTPENIRAATLNNLSFCGE